LSERGVLTIVALRIVPVAPFTVINIIAGISAIRLREFAKAVSTACCLA
jgi:uncharacterized membrane protein YdjX (TVP38/TMEM64 family)